MIPLLQDQFTQNGSPAFRCHEIWLHTFD